MNKFILSLSLLHLNRRTWIKYSLCLILVIAGILPATAQDGGYMITYNFHYKHEDEWPCGDYVRFYLTYQDGQVDKLVDWGQNEIKCVPHFEILEAKSFIVPPSKLVRSVEMTYDVKCQKRNSGKCNTCNGRHFWTPDPNPHKFTVTDPCSMAFYSPFSDGSSGGYFFSAFPFINKIGVSNVDNILPENAPVQLSAPEGFVPSLYNWEYSTDGDNWNSFPYSLYANGTPTATFTGKQLLGDNFDQAARIGGQVYFRIRLCDNTFSTKVTLTCKLSSPGMTGHSTEDPVCADGKGKLKIWFDRQLYADANEGLTINLLNDKGELAYQQANAVLAADMSYTWPQDILPGAYTIQLQGIYYPKGLDQPRTGTFSDDPVRHTRQFTISAPMLVTASTTAKRDISCFEGSDGSISLKAAGGKGGFVCYYKAAGEADWRPAVVFDNPDSHTLRNLPAGTYTIRIADSKGCSAKNTDATDKIITVTLQQPTAALEAASWGMEAPLAHGYADGSITVVLKGGTPNPDGSYNINWTRQDGTVLTPVNSIDGAGQYRTQLSALPAGVYIVSVTDANYSGALNGQTTCAYTQTFNLEEPPPLTVAIQLHHRISCNGDRDGELEAKVAGGIPYGGAAPYRYEWFSITGGVSVSLGQSTAVATLLPAGNYKVKVTDKNGISKESAPFTLTEPVLLQAPLTIKSVNCYGGQDGSVSAAITGGTLPYLVAWSNGVTGAAVISGLTTGSYRLQVKDDHGCEVVATGYVAQPAAALTINDVVTINPKAYGYTDGSVTATIRGGTAFGDGSYTVRWKDGKGQLLNGSNTVTPDGYVTTLANLGDGIYTLEVTDAQYATAAIGSTAGCMAAGSYLLKQPLPLTVALSEYHYVSCKDFADGQVMATARGGIPFVAGLPYKYEWSKQNGSNFEPLPATDSLLTGLTAGVYQVKITDYNNISTLSPVFVLVEPDKLNINFRTTPASCTTYSDGSITSTVTGGTTPYDYNWTTGDKTPALRNIPEGSYLLLVRDIRGCQLQKQVDLYDPAGLKTTVDSSSPVCHAYTNGYIHLNVTGGKTPYRYQWDNGATTRDLDNLPAGRYAITITDANGCQRGQLFHLKDPAPVPADPGTDKTLCRDQVWPVNVAIADPAAVYKWESDNGFSAVTAGVTLEKAGTYRVTVTDAKGCFGEGKIRIARNDQQVAAEFVVRTEVLRGVPVTLVNTSHPAPEKVTWQVPDDPGITILQQNATIAELRFDRTGTYTIGMQAQVGDCIQAFHKTVTVLEPQSFGNPGDARTPFIKEFSLVPNPSSGQFNVRISLDRPSAVRLRMLNVISHALVSDRQLASADAFNIPYSLVLPAGTYVLVLETAQGQDTRKIIIQ
ncbi:T9SS type A sorting domain-containing protein [Chitinophaga qingshengii]|uniref:T9SS type A sorting domain-containing protein n=1 Tax=Chitinophaga qingshengii TaxID=1569794 RepID=A0ABR7TRY2_9BACT|nr:T9SS type A sorting domain-containing protein [Chitinophaga qingshengii]MBC9932775.1 T9SS type A sorting domain-containing protein [Chitinophaga qingshengii]